VVRNILLHRAVPQTLFQIIRKLGDGGETPQLTILIVFPDAEPGQAVGCGDRPGWMIRELNGEKTVGRFLNGRFVPERKASSGQQAKAHAAKA